MSPVVRSDGSVAYVRGGSYRAGIPFRAQLLVRSAATSTPRRWTTTPGRYTVAAWAGSRILVHQQIAHSEYHDVVVFDGPGRARLLTARGELVAIAPSGDQALVSVIEPRLNRTRQLLLVDIATGATISVLTMDALRDPQSGTEPAFADDPGDWQGQRIAIRIEGGLAILSTASNVLATEAVYRMRSGLAFNEPRFAGAAVQTWRNLDQNGTSRWYRCDVAARSCVASRILSPSAVVRPVATDLSR